MLKKINTVILINIVALSAFILLQVYLIQNNKKLFEIIEFSRTDNNILDYIYVLIFLTTLLIVFINKKNSTVNNQLLIIYIFFLIPIYFITYTQSFLTFFIMYELLLLVTAITVYKFSPNIRSKTITFYFVVWTQLSSFLILLSIIYLYYYYNIAGFNSNTIKFISNSDKSKLTFLIIVGFGIKLPLWPFSYWLIKTHVEANTSFSIFLSGVLVKTALIGLIKFSPIITFNHYYLFVVILSLISSTINMFYQVDLKKLIAFTTIQEMSLILLFTYFNFFYNVSIILYFVLIHTIISWVLFYICELIYIRFKTRKTMLFLGIGTSLPKLNLVIAICWLFFISLPATIKFWFEFVALLKLLSLDVVILILSIVCLQYLTIVFFTRNFITYIFGNCLKISTDLTRNELFVITLPILILTLSVL